MGAFIGNNKVKMRLYAGTSLELQVLSQSKNLEDWIISRQLLRNSKDYFMLANPLANLDNPNKKGVLGEIAVTKELIKLGYEVFVEVGSHSKIDLIALDRFYRPWKIQIKTVRSRNNVVEVYSVKNCLNPKYNSTYLVEQVDIFAVYVCDRDLVFYVTAEEVLRNGKSSKFRLVDSRNGQKKHVRYVANYLDFEKALRDCTPHTLAANAVGDETVQTTTPITAAGESQSSR